MTSKQRAEDMKNLVRDVVTNAATDGLSTKQMTDGLEKVFQDFQLSPSMLKESKSFLCSVRILSVLTIVMVFVAFVLSYFTGLATDGVFDLVHKQDCLVPSNLLVNEIGRPVSDCSMCYGMESVPVSRNITKETFLKEFAYSGKPVLIKQATSDWLALEAFDFYFFRELYAKYPKSLQHIEKYCNFLRYNTEFVTLADFFKMDDDRVSRLDWYIGWSNCDTRVMMELRKYYQKPFFLPDDSISSNLDWIFIGGAGPGAGLHIDLVDSASWQAQIKGKKTWTLVPPPECEQKCQELNVTVEQGDIIVLDTNLWFHKTEIAKGEISITIGSEYD
ncbi:hypothetical protein HOLleu_26032 [Holothuria leucospilota]|uniref:JmjC domain-containing protein n=1 Tax=Holothuria leucospilota TaxID=206669 RepID=A0A9Q1H4Y2_HOLLE|nr:hypothetical protein HOLleu_26032 [Holothuria leucospilota]